MTNLLAVDPPFAAPTGASSTQTPLPTRLSCIGCRDRRRVPPFDRFCRLLQRPIETGWDRGVCVSHRWPRHRHSGHIREVGQPERRRQRQPILDSLERSTLSVNPDQFISLASSPGIPRLGSAGDFLEALVLPYRLNGLCFHMAHYTFRLRDVPCRDAPAIRQSIEGARLQIFERPVDEWRIVW